MDRVDQYREIVRRVLGEYAEVPPSHGEVRPELIFDAPNDHYEVIQVGWQGRRRVHGCVLHVDIIGGKIWIQYDGTNRPVAEELVRAGVPKDDIVLAFYPPDVRPHTGYAVA
ncbi:MAG: XisI protein [Gemmataceae bacterium]